MAEMILPDIKINTRQNMQAFLRAVSTAFGSRCQEHLGANGLLGFCVSDAQWASLPGVAIADENNAEEPIIAERLAIIFTPPLELGTAAVDLKQYEIAFRRNSAISDALRILNNSIIVGLPEADKNELSDPSFDLVSISCLQILNHLRERYVTFLASDFDSFHTELDTKIGTRTFPELAANHRFLHVQFASANQSLFEVDKCRYLRAAISSHISYSTAITSYLTAHPLVANQTFLGFVNHITEQAPNFTPTPIDLGYAAAASAPHQPAPEYFESAAFAAFLDKRISAALPRHPQTPALGGALLRSHCFKHGYDTHTSDKCRHMAAKSEYTVAMKTATTHTSVTNGSTQGL